MMRRYFPVLLTAAVLACLPASAGGYSGFYGGQDVKGGGDAAVSPALEPTHLMLVPTTQVLDKNEFVVSFHEFSYGIENNIQVSLFPWFPWNPTAGRVWLGAKFSARPDFSFGLGVSDRSDSYNFSESMVGAYAVKSFILHPSSVLYGMLDVQAGRQIYLEAGAGWDLRMTELLKVMSEGALYTNINNGNVFTDLDANFGLRYMWSTFKALKIDIGINLKTVAHNFDLWPYIDVSYSSKIK